MIVKPQHDIVSFPKNITEDIPHDVPFKAEISTISQTGDKEFPKKAISSMFPHNWSKERIMEEVAWVYDLSKKDKSMIKINPTTLSYGKIEGKCSSNFNILIEFDFEGNIVNAYPKF